MIQSPSRNGGGRGGSGGGGNLQSSNTITIRRTAAIGDVVSSLVVADKLIELGFELNFQSHPANHCVLRRHGRLSRISEPSGYTDVNLDGAYERDAGRRRKHFSTMFLERANEQLARFGISLGQAINCRPAIRNNPNDKVASRKVFENYDRPWVFVCPRSESYNVRQVPDGIWQSAAAQTRGTKFWIGRHPAPANFIDLKLQHLDLVINYLQWADLLITVDTGPMHLAAALGIPIVAINQSSTPDQHLSDQRDFTTVSPDLTCLNCQQNLCPIQQWLPPCQNVDPSRIAAAANARLDSVFGEKTSAIVAVWQPRLEVLNQCLSSLVDQVDEIVVAAEQRSILPPGVMAHPKIRHVKSWKSGIGFSGNANHGARQSNGKYLLFINDDVFLKPDAVAKMKEHMKPDVGIVSNLLRYPDGMIYHAGKVRSPGQRGWGHADYKHRDVVTFPQPAYLENCCGACVLTPRTVFYEAGCYDEELPLFAQDDAYALSVRRLGKRIVFTPYSEGVHLEHESVRKIGDVMDLVRSANTVFDRKWRWYFDLNINRVPGVFE